ncbi:MAG: antitoxin Xre/MbcA/ParS toxin-binding domain-containing protein [Trueperaceae bacterium]
MASKRFVPTRRPQPVPGARILGLEIDDDFQVAKRISHGFSTTTVGRLAKELNVTDSRILKLTSIPESTYHSRKRNRRPLSMEESSRVYRIAKTAAAAEAYFEGNKAAARRWLTNPKAALGGETPLEFARTPEGSDYVVKLLERMEHGIIS